MDAGTQVSRSEMWRRDAGRNASKKWTQESKQMDPPSFEKQTPE